MEAQIMDAWEASGDRPRVQLFVGTLRAGWWGVEGDQGSLKPPVSSES